MQPNKTKQAGTTGKDTTPKVIDVDFEHDEANVLGDVITHFNSARGYIKEHYEGVWADSFKLYNGIRTKRGYSGVSDEFVPETFSIVESLKASIAGSKPKFKYLPMTEEQEEDTTALNGLVEYYWSINNMTEKMLNWVGDMIIYGNGIFMVSWEKDHPAIKHVPLSDFFVDPSATHLNRPEEAGYPRYAGYRYLTSIEQIRSEKIVDVDTGAVTNRFKNIDEIGAGEKEEMDKDRKEMFLGSTYGKNAIKEQVEVVDYYTRNRHIMIANRDTVILDEETPYKKSSRDIPVVTVVDGQQIPATQHIEEIQGFLPFAILRNYVDSNLFFARGDVEMIQDAQEALNDTANQKRDNLSYALNNMWQIDPRFKHLAEQIKSAPGAVFPLPKGALTPIEKDDISPAADTEVARQTQVMRTATAADAAVQGVSQKFSRTTATEISAQLNQASMRFTTKVQNLEDEGFAQLARIIYKMIQIFVDTDMAVRIIGKNGVTFMTYNPDKFTGEYQPKVVLESTADAENQALIQAYQTAGQFAMNNPLVNQKSFLEKMFTAMFSKFLSDDDIQEMLDAPQPMMGPDGQPIDPSLVQSDALLTPGAGAMIRGEDQQGAQPRGRNQSTGRQGGGGAGTAPNNIRRPRSNQPSTVLSASSRAR